MHNVKKTPASEAQLAERDKIRNQKLEQFVQARNLIFSKREKNELDEELLAITGEVLKKGPDIYTFWNIRRDIINILKEKKEDESEENHLERVKTLYEDELKLTFKGIEYNPKSYSAWYQRDWILQNHPQPDLKAELALCEKSLSFVDSRNFHCWDHRRMVAKLAGFDCEEELAFSDRLIKLNPSNYSAWHYRGTLLQRMQKEKDPSRLLDDKLVAEELETVKNVCAYNSEDQTAWTYCRWLCEAVCTKVESAPVIVFASVLDEKSLGIVFSSALNEEDARKHIDLGEAFTLIKVSKFGMPDHKFSMVHNWILNVSDNLNDVRIKMGDEFVNIDAAQPVLNKDYLQKFYSLGTKCESEEERLALTGVAELCEGLMKEEEDIPWEVLMLARILPLLNGYTPETIDKILELLKRTAELDPQRQNVYSEMSNRLKKIRAICVKSEPNYDEAHALCEYFKISKSM